MSQQIKMWGRRDRDMERDRGQQTSNDQNKKKVPGDVLLYLENI